MMGKLFWFSATGNSYKAAKIIADQNRDFTLVKITDHLISNPEIIEEEEIRVCISCFQLDTS